MSGNWDVVWDLEPPLSADGSGTWDTFCHQWDDCILIIGGAGQSPIEAYNAYEKLDKKQKKRVIKVIVWLKSEIYEEEHPIENYKVTVEDMELLLTEYKKHKEKIKITVSNVEVK